MAATAVVDTSFLLALISDRDTHREWAKVEAARFPFPWHTCEAVLSEAFHLLDQEGGRAFSALLRRELVQVSFHAPREMASVLDLMDKYRQLPMAFADGCLVRMTEIFPEPVVLTTDSHFRIYRRHGRQVVPCVLPA